jgi:hypothetical protein
MKTPREIILGRHQSAEAKLKDIRAEDLAACVRSDRAPSRLAACRNTPGCYGNQSSREPLRPWLDLWNAAVSFWQEALWPWRRAWLGMAATWVFILAFSLAAGEAPRAASAKPPRPDPEALAVLQEQKELLAQLLGPGGPPQVSRLRTPGPRSEAEPPPQSDEGAGKRETILRAEAFGQA